MKILFISVLTGTLLAQPVQAGVLWTGGEDVDFQEGASVCINSTSYYRNGYARQAIRPCTGSTMAKSAAFPDGPVTSAWLSFRFRIDTSALNHKFVGLGESGTSSGIFVGNSGTTSNTIALWVYDGTTWNELATEAGSSIQPNTVRKIDMELINYGVAGTVNIYLTGASHLNGKTPILSFTGDLATGGPTSLDSVFLWGNPTPSQQASSEIIVADVDTRLMALVTLSPDADGDLNEWPGASYTDVNTPIRNDGNPISDNNAGDLFQCNVSDLPTGNNRQVLHVKVAARAAKGPSGIKSLSLGVKTNGSLNEPAAVLLPAMWQSVETYYSINPVTTLPWTSTDIDALQLNLKTAD